MNLEKDVRLLVRLFCDFQKRGNEVLARAFIAAVATHVDFGGVIEKLEAAFAHQEFKRRA